MYSTGILHRSMRRCGEVDDHLQGTLTNERTVFCLNGFLLALMLVGIVHTKMCVHSLYIHIHGDILDKQV